MQYIFVSIGTFIGSNPTVDPWFNWHIIIIKSRLNRTELNLSFIEARVDLNLIKFGITKLPEIELQLGSQLIAVSVPSVYARKKQTDCIAAGLEQPQMPPTALFATLYFQWAGL